MGRVASGLLCIIGSVAISVTREKPHEDVRKTRKGTKAVNTSPSEEIARLRVDIRRAHKERAVLVHKFMQALFKVAEKEAVISAMREAAYEVGVQAGLAVRTQLGDAEITPLQAVQNYEANSPDLGRLLPLKTECRADGSCDVETLKCPIKDAMEELGVSQQEFNDLVYVLDGSTAGALEALGLKVETLLPKLNGPICCKLRIERGA